MRRNALRLSLLLILVLPLLAQAQEKRATEPDDYYRVKRVGSTELSPDGRYLLYTIQTVRRRENDRLTEVWWADLEAGRMQRLSTAGVNTTNPHWTPDGRRIWFTTERGGESGTHFLNFLEPGGEAYTIRGVSGNPTFHPDGTWILTSRAVADSGAERTRAPGEAPGQAPGGAERTQRPERGERPSTPDGIPALTRRMGTEWAGTTEEARNRDVYVITAANYKRDGQLEFITGGSGMGGMRQFPGGQQRSGRGGGSGRHTQFFRTPADGLAEGEEPQQITFDPWNKTFAGFSPDGRFIIYTVDLQQNEERAQSPDETPEEMFMGGRGESRETGIFLLPCAGGEPRRIATEMGSPRGIVMSHAGDRLAYSISTNRESPAIVRVIDLEGKTIAEFGEDWVYGFGSLTWASDGRSLYTTSGIGGQTQVMRLAIDTGTFAPVTEGRHNLSSVSFDRDMTLMAYVKDTAEQPWEAFTAPLNGRGETMISRANTEWMNEVELSRVERFTFRGAPHNPDWLGRLRQRGVDYMMTHEAPRGERPEIEGWLMYPLDYQEGTKYPLVLSIHGGPHSQYGETWFHEFQLIAAQGIFVLYINPRGSSGYGREFSGMIMKAWGIDDYKDYLQAVDLVAARGIVDEAFMGVTGGSYGGYMTNWITSHTDRFRCAITARSISNWISFYGVSDASSLVEGEFGGRPWPFRDDEEGSWDLAMMLSPIAYADRVVTPTLIIHSINDYRCPLEEDEQWYRALQKNDVPVKMVLFPDSSHSLSRTGEPWLLVRRLHEYVDWFKAYLVDDEPVVAARGGPGPGF